MSNYNSTRQMVDSTSLTKRVAASAAGEGISNPEQWAKDQMWFLASSNDWVDSWSYAKSTETDDHNPDTGARPGVVSDLMILGAVQNRKTYLDSLEPSVPLEQAPPPA